MIVQYMNILLDWAEEIKRVCTSNAETEPLWKTMLGTLVCALGFLFFWIFAA